MVGKKKESEWFSGSDRMKIRVHGAGEYILKIHQRDREEMRKMFVNNDKDHWKS